MTLRPIPEAPRLPYDKAWMHRMLDSLEGGGVSMLSGAAVTSPSDLSSLLKLLEMLAAANGDLAEAKRALDELP